ncbi:hypothetical protein DAETH_46130 (plasmid) [Deinococcus aetherius]|uniref:Uncharacterized protein n=1 Tax=Deinococcus aetherius TaxID=200252 RepID=A0ABM8ALE0_9DEIO|nr:hypothetical protein DAETH_46130 [Deinococcus aetherius]
MEAAVYLTDLKRLRVLEPFFGEARSVTEAARQLGMKPNSLLYHVRRLLALGLLLVAAEEKRPGRSIRRYRVSADKFFVPVEATSARTAEELLARWERRLQDHLITSALLASPGASGPWGLLVGQDDRGLLRVTRVTRAGQSLLGLDPDQSATLLGWYTGLYLDFADAKAFQGELHDLILRYWKRGGGQQYALRVALAPLLGGDLPPLLNV